MSNEYKIEKVGFVPSPLNNGENVPRVIVTNKDSKDSSEHKHDNNSNEHEEERLFRGTDMLRVLDYNHMPEPPPPDTLLGHLEFELDDDDTISDRAPPRFPKRYFCLRGSFIFYFDLKDVENMGTHNILFKSSPLGVIPLEKTVVEFPPGGRRVFREHANTEARQGYEMMIRHVARVNITSGGVGGNAASVADSTLTRSQSVKRRAPAYLIMDGLGQRDFWAKAIRVRADVYMKDTLLRTGGDATSGAANGRTGGLNAQDINLDESPERSPDGGGAGGRNMSKRNNVASPDRNKASPERRATKIGGKISVLTGVMDTEEQKDVEDALVEFGKRDFFDEAKWVETFFEKNDEYEAPSMCRTLEKWQGSIKKGLRGAVLEQYEYFVEASREMTIMGKEVASLKDLVNRQVETIETMKNVEFDLDYVQNRPGFDISNSNDKYKIEDEEYSDFDGEDEEEDMPYDIGDPISSWGQESSSKQRNKNNRMKKSESGDNKDEDNNAGGMEVPEWLEDASEEIAALINQCRYTDATTLVFKARDEAMDTLNLHEKLTDKKLSRKQQVMLHRILRSLDHLTDRMCHRLSELLRRKNEALKQAAKKERADPLSALAPLVSPVALNDDAISLQLLVKLGKAQDAATAYSARRSLLLTECLHERPICNVTTPNNMDIVIYAAQLSHSFFSCLATSVEGFLDLFMDSQKEAKDDMSDASSTIVSNEKTTMSSASALAAVALWCDSELSKFSATFENKVLKNLSLSPRPNTATNKITDKITKFEVVADITYLKKQLKAAEEMGEYVAAGKLRKKIAIQEMEEKEGKTGHRIMSPKNIDDDERKLAIVIASKCVDQAFQFATDCLNAIGLPVTPRLAEYLRPRLKGAEADVAIDLEDKWDHIIFDWKDVSSPTGSFDQGASSPPVFNRAYSMITR